MTFKDHFSAHAGLYRRARPHYPDALFSWLAARVPGRSCAWDCATGNGQAARGLAAYFDRVVATDASGAQVAAANPMAGIDYRVAAAEHSGLADGSVDLITVAQAAHWFDLPRFYAEAERVLGARGMLALWCYQRMRVSPAVDQLIDHYYHDIVGNYWPAERRHVESAYRELPFPYRELPAPRFTMQARWSLPQLLDYLASWSASRHYAQARHRDPVEELADRLATSWGGVRTRTVYWPVALRVGRRD